MTTAVRVPPGRAGRLRLRRRLATAERGADLLERKLHVLLEEQRVRKRAAQESQGAWNRAAAEAEVWFDRALAACGHDGMRNAQPSAAAHVVIRETTAMGVRLCDEAAFTPAPDAANAADPGSAALLCAHTAMTRATGAACRAAVDLAAARALDAAVSTTRRQIRVLRRHWIPRLREALVQLEFALEQSDFEDGTRRRLAR
ncbi:MAG TPA: V-type ATP synthase subunit D [Actinocrinis sp.]|nr:V-type ATP synthase subunit D [Actinocrinis sp.]